MKLNAITRIPPGNSTEAEMIAGLLVMPGINIGSEVHMFKAKNRMKIYIVPTVKYLFLRIETLIKGLSNFG